MSREPRIGPDVPGTDSPSPDVLDELLRAFSIDPEEGAAHRDIDLTSPEVAELLTPSGGSAAPADDPEPEPVEATGSIDPDDRGDAALSDEPPADQPGSDGEVRGVAGDPFLAPATAAPPTVPAPSEGPRTISIVDEGLPDTVYIGGNLEPTDVGRATVVIDDRDPDGTTMTLEDAASATRIEPRMRERRIAVKRARGRKRLKWAALATVVVVLAVAALAVLGSGLFAVERVRVEGAERTSEAELAPMIADLEGTPVLRVDSDRIEDDLESLPWVDDARVTTRFPNEATIELRERTVAAAFQGSDGVWRLIDDTGRVLTTAAEAPAGYLAITGEGFPDVEPGVFAPSGLQGAAQLARSLTPTMAARAASISVTPDGSDLRMTFTDGTEVRFGPATGLVQKLVRLETKLDDLGDERVNYLDVSTNEVGQG